MAKYLKYIGLPVAAYALYLFVAEIILYFFDNEQIIGMTILIDLLMIIICIGIIKYFMSDNDLGYCRRSFGECKLFLWIALLIPTYLFGQIFATVIYNLYGDAAFDSYSSTMSGSSQYFYILLVLFVAPIYEELFFRGVVYRAMKQMLPVAIAAAISAAWFALIHGTVVHLVPTFLLGYLSCVVYEYTNDIRYSVFIHILNNMFSILMNVTIPDILTNVFVITTLVGILIAVFGIMITHMRTSQPVVDDTQNTTAIGNSVDISTDDDLT